MGKENIDICDVCGDPLLKAKDGIEIAGENIRIAWAGRNSPPEDPFGNDGVHIPMNGRVSLMICKECLGIKLGMVPLSDRAVDGG